MTEDLPIQATPTFLPRITQHDGRAIEEALASLNLFDPGIRLEGGVVEATYAATEPPILARLKNEGVPYLVDPQTSRFTGGRFLQVEKFEAIPYTPDAPLVAGQIESEQLSELAVDAMRFQQSVGAGAYLTAGLPFSDQDLQASLRDNDRLLDASCRANGAGDIERHPLVAQVVVGRKALTNPQLIVNRLIDYPIAGAYVQAQRLNPARDSVEKLTAYVNLLLCLKAAEIPVIAGRVGAFGLLLAAFGIPAFDSGLGQAEAFDLAGLNRPITDRERERQKEGKSGGGDRRVYFEQLKTTVMGGQAETMLAERGLRARLACDLDCCRHRILEDLPDRRRRHYLWARYHEISELRDRPSDDLRIDWVYERLRDAREVSVAVRRALLDKDVKTPDFAHLERWIGVLGRANELRAAV